MERENLMSGPPDTRLPDEPEAVAALSAAQDGAAQDSATQDGATQDSAAKDIAAVKQVAARFPAYSAAWATLAERAYADGDAVTAYAYARTGYHRGLDQLRRAGWHGNGPVPWAHQPNRGFLRSLHMLGVAAAAIGEDDEARRCQQFLADSSAEAARSLSGT